MGFPFKKLAQIGLGVGGVFAPGIPHAIGAAVEQLGSPETPDEAHEFAASGLRQIMAASFPESIDTLDEICAAWTIAAAQEREDLEREERLEKRRERDRARRKRRRRR